MTAAPASCEKVIMPGLESEAVEHYVSLQAQIKGLESELEELRHMIISFCQTEELNRIFGTEHAITYKMIEKPGYDEAQFKAILEPLGLWDKVLNSDSTLLEKLLADRPIVNDVRGRLQEMKCVLSSYPRLWVNKREPEE